MWGRFDWRYVVDKHGVVRACEGSLEGCEEGGFAAGSGVKVEEREAAEGGGGGVDGVDEVEDGGRADATKRGEHPREEGAVAGH